MEHFHVVFHFRVKCPVTLVIYLLQLPLAVTAPLCHPLPLPCAVLARPSQPYSRPPAASARCVCGTPRCGWSIWDVSRWPPCSLGSVAYTLRATGPCGEYRPLVLRVRVCPSRGFLQRRASPSHTSPVRFRPSLVLLGRSQPLAVLGILPCVHSSRCLLERRRSPHTRRCIQTFATQFHGVCKSYAASPSYRSA